MYINGFLEGFSLWQPEAESDTEMLAPRLTKPTSQQQLDKVNG